MGNAKWWLLSHATRFVDYWNSTGFVHTFLKFCHIPYNVMRCTVKVVLRTRNKICHNGFSYSLFLSEKENNQTEQDI